MFMFLASDANFASNVNDIAKALLVSPHADHIKTLQVSAYAYMHLIELCVNRHAQN